MVDFRARYAFTLPSDKTLPLNAVTGSADLINTAFNGKKAKPFLLK